MFGGLKAHPVWSGRAEGVAQHLGPVDEGERGVQEEPRWTLSVRTATDFRTEATVDVKRLPNGGCASPTGLPM